MRAKGRVEEWGKKRERKNSFVGKFSEIKQILSINVLSRECIRRRQLKISIETTTLARE